MNTSDFTTIATAPTAIDAELILSMLRAEGLHPLDLAMSAHVSIAGADLAYPIRVPAAEAVAARECLSTTVEEPGSGE